MHALVTDGVVTPEGAFLSLLAPDLEAVCEVFRRLVLAELRRAERLSEAFHERLLAWSPSGFSVHGAQVAHEDEPGRLERLARYVTRAPLAVDRVQPTPQGRVRVETPPDPASGATVLDLDPLEFVHRVTQQIPDPRRHLVRYYGAYSSRTRGARQARQAAAAAAGHTPEPGAPTTPSPSRASWARLLRRIFEVDPLLCPRCGGRLAVVAVLVDPKVVDQILRHLTERGRPTSVHARDPPAA